MCGLAELLHNMGARVTGSDLSENANVERLRRIGVKVYNAHNESNVGDADVVVFSSAISDSNPELQKARSEKIPLIPRAEALAEIMRLKRGVAVAGTHGKTTTTSIAASIFLEAKHNPTIVVGGRFARIDSTALLGDGEWLIAEADESDGSFQKLSPEIAIITNVDSDHMDYYKSFENLQKAFLSFANRIPFYGVVVVFGDDPALRKLFSQFSKRVIFYGFGKENDYQVRGENGSYEILDHHKKSQSIGRFKLKIPGKHNALNAAAAFLTAIKAGISPEVASEGVSAFEGVDRRFHLKGESQGILIYDDYGHHPTEVAATLEGFKEKFPDRRLVVYFQPHRYSRTQTSWHEFTRCFTLADKVLLADIYPAGESAISGVNSLRLSQEVQHSDVSYVGSEAKPIDYVLSQLKSGDVFVTLGAGDGWKVGIEVLKRLSS